MLSSRLGGRRPSRWFGALLGFTLVSALGSTGCYRYVAAPIGSVEPGTEVRLLVDQAGIEQASRVTSIEGPVPWIEGTFLERSSDSLLVRVQVGQRREGFHTVSLDQAIRVPLREVLQAERRVVDWTESALLVGGGVGLSAFIILTILDEGLGEQGREPAGPLESLVSVPLFSFPFRR